MLRLIVTLALLALGTPSCAFRSPDLPGGLGVFEVAEGARLIEQIAIRCNETEGIEPWIADVEIRGSVGPTAVEKRLRVAFNPASASVRVESVPQHGDGSFVLVATGGPTTLVLDDGARVLKQDRFPPVLAAIAGLDLGPHELGQLVRGCHMIDLCCGYVTSYGDHWRRITSGRNGMMYYHRRSLSDPWRMVTMFYPGAALDPRWRMDYRDIREGIPRTLVITGISAGSMNLEVKLVALDVRVSLPPEVFQVEVPPSSQPIALSEITARRLFGMLGPLGKIGR